jgi:hypothetical protein
MGSDDNGSAASAGIGGEGLSAIPRSLNPGLERAASSRTVAHNFVSAIRDRSARHLNSGVISAYPAAIVEAGMLWTIYRC